MSEEIVHDGTNDHSVDLLRTKIEVLEEKLKALSERVSENTSMMKNINELAMAVERATINQQQMLEKIKDHESRLEAIEEKPVKRWDSVVDKVIMVLLGAVLAYVLTKVGL